eukprot:1136157-Pelagomonas_calceolata.AAC.14
MASASQVKLPFCRTQHIPSPFPEASCPTKHKPSLCCLDFYYNKSITSLTLFVVFPRTATLFISAWIGVTTPSTLPPLLICFSSCVQLPAVMHA